MSTARISPSAKRISYVLKTIVVLSAAAGVYLSYAAGGVFCFVLAPVMRSNAWNIRNVLTHVVVPVAAVLDFFVTGVFYFQPSKICRLQ